MNKHQADKLDIFETSLSIAKTICFILEGEEKE